MSQSESNNQLEAALYKNDAKQNPPAAIAAAAPSPAVLPTSLLETNKRKRDADNDEWTPDSEAVAVTTTNKKPAQQTPTTKAKATAKRKRTRTKKDDDDDDPTNMKAKTPNKHDETFTRMAAQYKAFRDEHGPTAVLFAKEHPKLCVWADSAKAQYSALRRNKPSTLTIQRLIQLIEVGFVFPKQASVKGIISWDERIEQCRQFQQEHGHLQVKNTHPVLGRWCETVKKYKQRNTIGRTTPLTPEREKMLADLGFVWQVQLNKPPVIKTFDQRLEEFNDYRQTFGHPFVPQHLPEPRGLGRWVAEQRREYKMMQDGNKKSYMTPQRALILTNVGFKWNAAHIRRTPIARNHPHQHEHQHQQLNGNNGGHSNGNIGSPHKKSNSKVAAGSSSPEGKLPERNDNNNNNNDDDEDSYESDDEEENEDHQQLHHHQHLQLHHHQDNDDDDVARVAGWSKYRV